MEKKKNKKQKKYILLPLLLIPFCLMIYGIYLFLNNQQPKSLSAMYVASESELVSVYDVSFKEVNKVHRGRELKVYNEVITDDQKLSYVKVYYDGEILYVKKDNLVSNIKNAVKEKKVYVRTPATLYKNLETGEIESLVKKGDELEVIGYDELKSDGRVNAYQVKKGDIIGYVYQKYVLTNKEDALANYDPSKYYDVHNNRGDQLKGGHAGNLDYYPVEKAKFEDNVMPEKVYALYLNRSAIKNVDDYIEFAKTTKINTFVVDIKDNGAPAYKSKVFESLSPTNYKYANSSFEEYKENIKKIKSAGFYAIGRITTFQDEYYSIDHPEHAIRNTTTNEPYLHGGTYWPSPFQRAVWEYNVKLAKEAVIEMGFNEIQFDYVRFPDRTGDAEKSGAMDFRNEYDEEKAQAIQRFVMYATDELHKLNVYVSVDVFGESAYTYVTAYGQYWPAISNVVDVISGMPYPDHFNKYEFGFNVPVWTVPYELLSKWSSYVVKRQEEIPTPAVVRTWIQVSDVPNYKHSGGYPYGVKEIDAQIRGLFDKGLNGGYMTWLSSSNLERYKSQKEVYDKEY
ncbi:MAG TPA: hypothetical protein GXZ95_01460 [Mollicutes bacterium]|nr:hypothetical protein [Mollicutes bacterium]